MYCGIAPQRASVWRRASSLPTGWTSASDVTIASQPPPVCAMLQSSYRQTRVAIEPSSASRMTPYEMPSGRPAGGVGSIATSSASQARSEEHTSELSRLHLVCRLLLEKKKNKNPTILNQKHHNYPHLRALQPPKPFSNQSFTTICPATLSHTHGPTLVCLLVDPHTHTCR